MSGIAARRRSAGLDLHPGEYRFPMALAPVLPQGLFLFCGRTEGGSIRDSPRRSGSTSDEPRLGSRRDERCQPHAAVLLHERRRQGTRPAVHAQRKVLTPATGRAIFRCAIYRLS
jgi:hypothetical protein